MAINVISLISEEEIREKVRELGSTISSDYNGKTVHVVGILKGAWMFMADLVRQLTVPVSTDFISIASYGSRTETSGTVRLLSDLSSPLEGKHVLVVEDIVDTGLSLQFLLQMLSSRRPESLKICALLDKPERHRVNVEIAYLGFTIPDKFVVGYGIDFDGQLRNLSYIGYVDFSPDEL